MSNTPNLLPCAFCGGMATAKPIDSVPGWHHVTVLHSDCFYKPAQDKMLLNDEHLAAWNRRTLPPVVREPLTAYEIHESIKAFKESENLIGVNHIHVARAIERAHGITQRGGSNVPSA